MYLLDFFILFNYLRKEDLVQKNSINLYEADNSRRSTKCWLRKITLSKPCNTWHLQMVGRNLKKRGKRGFKILDELTNGVGGDAMQYRGASGGDVKCGVRCDSRRGSSR